MLGLGEVGGEEILRTVGEEVETCSTVSPGSPERPRSSPVIMHTPQMQRSQLVLSMRPNSRMKLRVASRPDTLFALASSRASRYCLDSGSTARTMAAAREKPAPMKYRERQVYLDFGTTPRLMTAPRR